MRGAVLERLQPRCPGAVPSRMALLECIRQGSIGCECTEEHHPLGSGHTFLHKCLLAWVAHFEQTKESQKKAVLLLECSGLLHGFVGDGGRVSNKCVTASRMPQ